MPARALLRARVVEDAHPRRATGASCQGDGPRSIPARPSRLTAARAEQRRRHDAPIVTTSLRSRWEPILTCPRRPGRSGPLPVTKIQHLPPHRHHAELQGDLPGVGSVDAEFQRQLSEGDQSGHLAFGLQKIAGTLWHFPGFLGNPARSRPHRLPSQALARTGLGDGGRIELGFQCDAGTPSPIPIAAARPWTRPWTRLWAFQTRIRERQHPCPDRAWSR